MPEGVGYAKPTMKMPAGTKGRMMESREGQTMLGDMAKQWNEQVAVMSRAGYEYDNAAKVWRRPDAPPGLRVLPQWDDLAATIKRLSAENLGGVSVDFDANTFMSSNPSAPSAEKRNSFLGSK